MWREERGGDQAAESSREPTSSVEWGHSGAEGGDGERVAGRSVEPARVRRRGPTRRLKRVRSPRRAARRLHSTAPRKFQPPHPAARRRAGDACVHTATVAAARGGELSGDWSRLASIWPLTRGFPAKKISRPPRRLSIPPARATTGAAPSSRAARARVASGGGRGGVPRRRPGRHPAGDPPRARVVGPLTVPLVTQRGMQGPPLLAVDAKLNGPPRRRRRWVRPPARPRHVGGPPRGRSRAH